MHIASYQAYRYMPHARVGRFGAGGVRRKWWSDAAVATGITLFKAALKNPNHVIHPLLPPSKPPSYNLRKRSHGLLLPTTQSNLLRKNFVYRILFKDIY